MSISDKDCAYLNYLVMKHHALDKLIVDTRDLDLEFIRLSGNIEDSGFLAVAFLTNHSKSIVIAHRGTDFFNCKPINGIWKFNGCKKFFSTDFSDDIGVALGNVPEQMVQAETFYTSIFQAYPDYTPICTGYSLGGVYAELLGLRYGVQTTSFDTPEIKRQAESYLSAGVVERNKHFITCYKSSPNFINTNGEQYARIIRIEFVTDTFGLGVVDYALYTFVQHDIELLWGYFSHQREVRDWPNGFVAGYNSYLSVAENSLYWEKHIEDLWFKHKFFVDHLPSEMKIRARKEFAEKFKIKYLHSHVSHMHSKPELEGMHDSLVKSMEKGNCLVLNTHRSQYFNEVTGSVLSIIREQGDYPKKEEDLIPPYRSPDQRSPWINFFKQKTTFV